MKNRGQTGIQAIGWGAALVFLAAPAIFAYRLFHWLKMGEWQPITLNDFVMPPAVNWVGVQKSINWIFACEIEWVAFCAGLAIMFIGIQLADTDK